MELKDLDVYNLSRDLSKKAWEIYNDLKKEYRFSFGKQFLDSSDSVGANIAEGFGRFHYKDSMKFYYNSRGSLYEAKHWIDLLNERGILKKDDYKKCSMLIKNLGIKLNNFISSLKKSAGEKK